MRHKFYLLAFFDFGHLPDHLQKISEPFYNLAEKIEQRWYDNSSDYAKREELEKCMHKLLEAKDCAVRAGV